MFKRRDRPGIWNRVLAFLWPRRGHLRGWRYIGRRVQRLNDSPESIALGFACGSFASFTPFFGFHFGVAALLAWIARGNIIASLFGTIIGNPLSFPLIATGSMSLGSWLMGTRDKIAGDDADGVIVAFVDIAVLLYDLSRKLLGFPVDAEVGLAMAMVELERFWEQIMLPYTVGGTILGSIVAITCYYVLRPAIAAYQKARSEKLAARRAKAAR